MQAEAGKTPSLELANRRLIDARKGLHRALGQARPATPFVCFAANPDQFLGHVRLQ
jgi:hypothetical protein